MPRFSICTKCRSSIQIGVCFWNNSKEMAETTQINRLRRQRTWTRTLKAQGLVCRCDACGSIRFKAFASEQTIEVRIVNRDRQTDSWRETLSGWNNQSEVRTKWTGNWSDIWMLRNRSYSRGLKSGGFRLKIVEPYHHKIGKQLSFIFI